MSVRLTPVPLTATDIRPRVLPPPGTPRRFPRIFFAVLLVVAALLGYTAGGRDKVDRSRLAAAMKRATTGEAAAAAAGQRADNALDLARQQANAELSARSAQLDQREQALNSRDQAVAAREKALTAAQTVQSASSFADGTYQVGLDIKPGTYHSPGPADAGPAGTPNECMWKTLDGNNATVQSYHQPGPAVVVIDPTVKFFATHGCGLWTKR